VTNSLISINYFGKAEKKQNLFWIRLENSYSNIYELE
jgi:hypothetical protein